MTETTQTTQTTFEYSNRELIVLLLRTHGVHEGHWHLSAKLAFSAMNIGQSPDGTDASPAGVVAVNGVRIVRIPEPLPFSVNAAEVNPKK
jgi:hypothetical protein